jgi:rubrerythrin
MRRTTTFHLLSAGFALAALGCKKEPLPEPPPPVPLPSTPPAVSAPAPVTIMAADAPLRYGQRCPGSIVSKLKPKEPVDYLELRIDYYYDRNRQIFVAGPQGEACKNAKDATTCKSTLAEVKADKGGEYLVYTRGDEIKTVNGAATGPFLAPIESAEEAAATLVYTLLADTSTAAVLPSCDPKEYRETPDGWEMTHTSSSFCGEKTVSTYAISKAGAVKMTKSEHTPPKPDCHPPQRGRRPEGLVRASRDDGATLGGHFAEAAEMEAASVPAFERLEAELRAMGAPETLRRRSRRAAEDETRHARSMTSLAERFGASPAAFVVESRARRSIVEMAIENAVEGCVFETWAALLATWQAAHARDAEIRAAMKAIARDETRHAALAWDVATFLETRLAPSDVVRVREARASAFAELARMIAAEPSDELRTIAGLPSASEARALFEQALEVVDDVAAAA